MNAYVALIRAVNVGGTGKLPMSDLKELCEGAGFLTVRTYLASGNAVFASSLSEARVKAALESALKTYAGKPVGVLLRTAAEMAAVVAGNPFPDALLHSGTVAIFSLTSRRPPDPPCRAGRPAEVDEEIRLPAWSGDLRPLPGTASMGRSKLKDPAVRSGTRNINTIIKLAEMAAWRWVDRIGLGPGRVRSGRSAGRGVGMKRNQGCPRTGEGDGSGSHSPPRKRGKSRA